MRLQRALRTVIQELRIRNIPLKLSSFTPRSLRELFPPSLHPTALSTAFFPHLKDQAHLLFNSPIELARLECKQRRQKLLQLRNDRAQELGELLLLKREIEEAVKSHSDTKDVAIKLQSTIGDVDNGPTSAGGAITILKSLSSENLETHSSSTANYLFHCVDPQGSHSCGPAWPCYPRRHNAIQDGIWLSRFYRHILRSRLGYAERLLVRLRRRAYEGHSEHSSNWRRQ